MSAVRLQFLSQGLYQVHVGDRVVGMLYERKVYWRNRPRFLYRFEGIEGEVYEPRNKDILRAAVEKRYS